jgi:glutaredoxin
MEDTEQPRQEQKGRSNWFETLMELTVSTAPLVLVVLGIGMMSFAPRRSSVPLFRSHTEAEQFYNQNGMTLSYNQPVILVASKCTKCDDLKASLNEIGIPYVEQNIEGTQIGSALHGFATRVSGSEKLPQVVLGDQLVHPAPYSIRIALRRFNK